MIRFDFPPGMTPQQIAAALQKIRDQHKKK
jgi:hypothetical protein